MGTQDKLGGMFTFRSTSITVNRIGYGGMSLAGPMAFGPVKDKNSVLSVLIEAVRLGISILVKLKNKGLIKNIGLSNISHEQYVESKAITEIVCIQNHYNLAMRNNDAMVDELNSEGIAFVPFFPLGGFRPIQSETLDKVAASLGATPRQVALAWLLQRSPNILLIPGTSSVEHLRENVKAGSLKLSADAVEELNQVGMR